jgi:hypothetical protein
MGCGASKEEPQKSGQQKEGDGSPPKGSEPFLERDEDEVEEVVNELNPMLLCTLRDVMFITRLQARYRGRLQRKKDEARKEEGIASVEEKMPVQEGSA